MPPQLHGHVHTVIRRSLPPSFQPAFSLPLSPPFPIPYRSALFLLPTHSLPPQFLFISLSYSVFNLPTPSSHLTFVQHFRCVCASGQLSVYNNKQCQESSAFLVYAIRSQIRFLFLDPKVKIPPFPAITGLNKHAAVALDFDYEEKLLFFTVLKKSIFSVYINGSGLRELTLPS